MSEVHLDEVYAEARFHGAVTDQFSWVVNFNGSVNVLGGTGPNGVVGVEDLIAQFKAAKEFQIWAGRLLVPSDSANFSGPFFMIPWNYPGFYIPGAAPIGPAEGPYGRNQGVTVWGNAVQDKLKYYAGVYGLDEDAHPFGSARVSYSPQGSEPGYFGSNTYYGAQNVVTIGVGAQYQRNGATEVTDAMPGVPAVPTTAPPTPKDYYSIMADAFVEENLSGAGTLTFQAQYYHFPSGYLFSGGLPPGVYSPQNAFYALLAYLTPNNIGIGKLQPMLRIQQTADPAWTLFDGALAYVIKDYSARIVATYQHADLRDSSSAVPANARVQNSLQLSVQLQTL
jgi:hypothetical protein